ncbi:hypothetical protein O181_027432 [Austropuccinia psidii MF-1]|uniref:Uncharacterized protein n=1 Tax=Austropuccinia psidii MF-1 TaxID=1389203 RepID=A0A9Q3CQ12_9BASI|nr:hypothetical protein [Austropuccinia psidii MF-1]
MSTLTYPYASATPPPPHDFPAMLLPHPCASAPLPHPHDFPQTLQPYVGPHQSLRFGTPSAYHACAPTQYMCLMPPPLLNLPHPRLIFSAGYHAYTPVLDL